jgi:hypothetical protein
MTIDPATPQGAFDLAVWTTLSAYLAGVIFGMFVKLINRS